MMEEVYHHQGPLLHRQRSGVAKEEIEKKGEPLVGIRHHLVFGPIGQELIGGHLTTRMRCQSFLVQKIINGLKNKFLSQVLQEGERGVIGPRNLQSQRDHLRRGESRILLQGEHLILPRCLRCRRRRTHRDVKVGDLTGMIPRMPAVAEEEEKWMLTVIEIETGEVHGLRKGHP